jgi:hypothetical protein
MVGARLNGPTSTITETPSITPTVTLTPTVTATPTATDTPTSLLEVVSVEDLGTLTAPCFAWSRDGALSTEVQGQRLWIFGDTWGEYFLPIRSMTHAWDRWPVWQQPIQQTIPLTAEETAWNQTHTDSRYGTWFAGITEKGGLGVIYFLRVWVPTEPFGQRIDYGGVATIEPGASVATRLDVQVDHEVFPSGHFEQLDGYWYGLGNAPDLSAVALRLGDPLDPDTWRAWDGSAWVSDLSEATVLWDWQSNPSLVYSEYLSRYVASYSTISNDVNVRLADAPQGPWSEPIELFEAMAPTYYPGGWPYVWWVTVHDEMEIVDETEQWLATYSRPLSPGAMEIRAARVTVR